MVENGFGDVEVVVVVVVAVVAVAVVVSVNEDMATIGSSVMEGSLTLIDGAPTLVASPAF